MSTELSKSQDSLDDALRHASFSCQHLAVQEKATQVDFQYLSIRRFNVVGPQRLRVQPKCGVRYGIESKTTRWLTSRLVLPSPWDLPRMVNTQHWQRSCKADNHLADLTVLLGFSGGSTPIVIFLSLRVSHIYLWRFTDHPRQGRVNEEHFSSRILPVCRLSPNHQSLITLSILFPRSACPPSAPTAHYWHQSVRQTIASSQAHLHVPIIVLRLDHVHRSHPH
jgi:hypothetical protein